VNGGEASMMFGMFVDPDPVIRFEHPLAPSLFDGVFCVAVKPVIASPPRIWPLAVRAAPGR